MLSQQGRRTCLFAMSVTAVMMSSLKTRMSGAAFSSINACILVQLCTGACAVACCSRLSASRTHAAEQGHPVDSVFRVATFHRSIQEGSWVLIIRHTGGIYESRAFLSRRRRAAWRLLQVKSNTPQDLNSVEQRAREARNTHHVHNLTAYLFVGVSMACRASCVVCRSRFFWSSWTLRHDALQFTVITSGLQHGSCSQSRISISTLD